MSNKKESEVKEETTEKNENVKPENLKFDKVKRLTKLEQAEKDAAEYKDLALRRMAELENFRRNNQNAAKDARDRALQEIILQFVPALDSFERAEQMIQDEKTKSGIGIVKEQLFNVLNKYNVKPIDAKDKDFDPALHECIMQVDSIDKVGKVIYEIEKGYTMNDKVIKYAKVAVGKEIEK